jgi:WD40 repeat protein
MGVDRTLHTATLLRDGKVLVAGGSSGAGMDLFFLANAELFDPVAGAFTPARSMGMARAGHTATLLRNGKVLIAGDGGFGPTAEIYDPAGDSFTPTGSMAFGRLGHTATLLPNGKVLVAGSRSATAEVYDPATGSFTLTGSMGTAREHHTATLLPDGRVLVVGGTYFIQNPDGTFTFVTLATAEVYDPTTGTFTPTGSMGTAREHHTATLLPDGRVLVVGGGASGGSFSGALATAEIYNPATGSFTPTGSMGTARRLGHAATLLLNGKVLVTGGIGKNLFALETAELYDPATGAFTATGTMATAREDHTQTLLLNGKVLVTGGCPDITATSELYE